jgi:hypothetical protein
MKVDVHVTEEEKNTIPNWEERVARFQEGCDCRERDLRLRFRLVLHEAGHTVQYRQFGWEVKFFGPYVIFEDGDLRPIKGAVSPRRTNNYEPLFWQHGMVCIAGFWMVEHFTAIPNDKPAIRGDLKSLRKELAPDEDFDAAVNYAEIMLGFQISEPDFLPQLKQACRDYEMDVFGNTDATEWGWKEYHPELKGERCSVTLPPTNQRGLLIGDNLYVGGVEVKAEETFHGRQPRVSLHQTRRRDAPQMVRRWNERVYHIQGSLLPSLTGVIPHPMYQRDQSPQRA